ncbi:MAG TPA: histidine kinase [Bacteroidales bacterium]|nr:histidine kinase [Bacteroidales bacterium]
MNNTYDDKIDKNQELLFDWNATKAFPGVGFLVGLAFPVIAWFIDMESRSISVDISGLIEIHLENPVHFIIDVIPFILAILGYFLASRTEAAISTIKNELSDKEAIIEENTKLAQRIGDPEYTTQSLSLKSTDNLGRTLFILHQNLIKTDTKEKEQNWISQGRDLISGVLRKHNNIETLSYDTLVHIINYIEVVQGALYLYDNEKNELVTVASHAYNRKKHIKSRFKIGEGLVGQTAYELDYIYRTEIPDDFISISSGLLGDTKPASILLTPLVGDEKLQGVIELASLNNEIPELTIRFVRELSDIIGQTLFNLKVNARTAKLLEESQILTKELKVNEEELRKNALQMKYTQDELKRTNEDLEAQIEEVERAQKRLYSLLENASEVISIYNENGIITYESPSVKEILGYKPEEVVGKNAFNLSQTPAGVALKDIFNQLIIKPEDSRKVEYEFTKKNGDTVWLETTGRNFSNNPAIKGIIFNTRDITVRKIAEQAEKKSGQMQALSENSPDLIIRFDLNGTLFYTNPIVEKYIGVRAKNLINKRIEETEIEPFIRTLFANCIDNVRASLDKYEYESDFPTPTSLKIVQINGIPEFSESGKLDTVLLVIHDITERKTIEQEIQLKNKNINDSINYAHRIQEAILPDNKLIRDHLPKSFVFYKPRDVVSGDFPWFFKHGDNIYIAAVDCTGHGVPGAMLAFVAYFLLNNIVDHETVLTAGEVLDKLHEQVRKTLKQDRVDANARDGMDIAFCRIDTAERVLHYAGAHRPLYHLRDRELNVYKGNPKAIGGIPHRKNKEKNFVNHVINYNLGDKIFFFSDGLPDQIGGSDGRKYQVGRIQNVITENAHYSMNQFFRFFSKDFNKWKSNYKQIDDVLMIGIEF